MDGTQLFPVNLSSAHALSHFLSLLAPYVPHSLSVLGNVLESNEDDRSEHRRLQLWATFSFGLEYPLPPLFSVIAISPSDYQSRFFCSADASPDTPTPEEERHATSAIRSFQQTRVARKRNSLGMQIIIGSVHSKWAACLQDLASRISPCLKYLRRPQPVPGVESYDHIGCAMSVLQSRDLDFVLERCHISRSREYLLSRFPFSVCLRIQSETYSPPVSWVVLHSDGSLGMLHVEPEFRRRGIAQTLVNELVRRREGVDNKFVERRGGAFAWNWVDVVESNKEGSRFFKSLDGWEEGWTSLWLYLKNEDDDGSVVTESL
jgi:ribosomal protein S18 acetylase RimI-like enzyme